MGFFRFRRSVKLFPGIRWNFGKKSTSLSIGGRGANYTVGTSGSRTTVGIPGTGLSYTEIHNSHSRVAARNPRIPTPSESWIRNNRINVTISTPDRQPGEAPIRPDQLDTIKSITPDFDLSKVSGFGEVQAESLNEQLRYQQKEASKTLLKQFYAHHGHAVSDTSLTAATTIRTGPIRHRVSGDAGRSFFASSSAGLDFKQSAIAQSRAFLTHD